MKSEKLGQCKDFKKNEATFIQDFKDRSYFDISFLFREVKGNFFYEIMVIVNGKVTYIQNLFKAKTFIKNNYFHQSDRERPIPCDFIYM